MPGAVRTRMLAVVFLAWRAKARWRAVIIAKQLLERNQARTISWPEETRDVGVIGEVYGRRGYAGAPTALSSTTYRPLIALGLSVLPATVVNAAISRACGSSSTESSLTTTIAE